jgi:hypothetical protein
MNIACRWLLIALVLCLNGCSTIKLAYNQADHILAWMADDYFDLNGIQKEALRAHLGRFHAWHRATELSAYAAVLDSAQRRVQAGLTTEDVDWITAEIRARYRALVVQACPDAAGVLATLNDEQLLATRRQFERSNRKYAKDHGLGAPAEEQKRLRARQDVERIEHWTGPLDASQEAKLREISRSLPLLTDLRYQERLRRQEQFLALIRTHKDPAVLAARLRDWLLDWESARSPEYRQRWREFAAARAEMYVQAVGLLSSEQRHHLVSVIHNYRQAFLELAAQAPSRRLAAQP